MRKCTVAKLMDKLLKWKKCAPSAILSNRSQRSIKACKSCLSAYHKERYRTQQADDCSNVRFAHSTCGPLRYVPSPPTGAPFIIDAASNDDQTIRALHIADAENFNGYIKGHSEVQATLTQQLNELQVAITRQLAAQQATIIIQTQSIHILHMRIACCL